MIWETQRTRCFKDTAGSNSSDRRSCYDGLHMYRGCKWQVTVSGVNSNNGREDLE